MPKNQKAFTHKKMRVVNIAFNVRNQTHLLIICFQLHGHHRLEQPGELICPFIHRLQRMAINNQCAHGGKGACSGTPGAHTHKFIIHAAPDNLQQQAELVAAYPGHFNAQQICRYTRIQEHFPGIKPQMISAGQSGLHKVP